MKQSEAWVLQAKSDFAAAQAVINDTDEPTYCQAIAKYQQVTEKSIKSIKGIIRTLNEQGAANIRISTTQHKVYREMNELNSLRRDRLKSDDKKWVDQINKKFNGLKADIEWLCDLAPSGQRDGTFFKNTEYPFNDASPGGWTAPAAPGIYTSVDVTRAYNLAQKLIKQADKFTSAMNRR